MRSLLAWLSRLALLCALLIALSIFPPFACAASTAGADTLFVVTGDPATLSSGGHSSLWRTDLLGHVSRLLSRDGFGSLSAPVRSPDGRHIAYVVDGQALWQMNADGSNARRLYVLSPSSFGRISTPRYTVDSQTLSFTAGCCAEYAIYSIAVDGTRLRRVLGGGITFLQDWSPDGIHLLYTVNGALWSADGRGNHAHPLGGDAPEAGSFFDAHYSPDGSHILTSLRPAQGTEEAAGGVIAMLHPDGRYLTILTRDLPLDVGQPTWSPDGKRIAFVVASGTLGPLGRLHDLWIMRYDGTQKRNITHGRLGDILAAAWAR